MSKEKSKRTFVRTGAEQRKEKGAYMSNIDIFANEYLGKLFYFCLKKTGNEQEAADLFGEISLEIVQALMRGREPDSFEAWLWAVARNRWAKWAAKKYYRDPERVDIQEYEETLPTDQSVEDDVIHSYELASIRRGLAFIRSDYRTILVAHYFEEKSVSEISRQFGIPIGTVKTKLQSSRKILKEGMDMAKQFGLKSFQPETLGFISSGYHPTGLPFSAINRKIPVNILCEADNNASTIGELSMELGIAMPYMEEEVRLLEESELLRKLDDGRYITNFFISPKECQNEINELSCRFAEKNGKAVWDVAGKVLENGRKSEILKGIVSDADVQAYFAFYIEQGLEGGELPGNIFYKFKRRDGGNWGFLGKEAGAVCRLPRQFFNNNMAVQNIHRENSGEQDMAVRWNGYQSDSDYGNRPYKHDVPESDDLALLKEVAEGREISSCSVTDEQCLKHLIDQGFCALSQDGRVQVAAITIRNSDSGKITEYLGSLCEYRQLKEEMHEYIDGVRKIIARYCAPYLKEDFDYYVGMSAELRSVFSMLWKNQGLYTGGNAQFSALYY